VRYHTYFDESVSGLEVGSTVVFRGVRIGNVGAIGIAPDRTRIDVALDLWRPKTSELEMTSLVASLESSGITGVKFVELSPRKPGAPLPELAFEPDPRYVPAARSLLATLEERAAQIAMKTSELVEHADAAIDRLGGAADDFRAQRIAARLGSTLDRANVVLDDARRVVQGLAPVPGKLDTALGNVDGAAARLRDVIGRFDAGDELAHTIRDIGDAARMVREFVDELEREPDMLLKGRGRSGP
jgi:phospholipid/cholesterol/gamma-HCH transport system substrate-binding protein